MQKAKQALVEAGVIKSAGRGRISAEGHAWLKARYDEGIRFSDWPKGKVEVTKTEANGNEPAKSTVKVHRAASTGEKVISEIIFTYPESEFEAYEYIDGKKKSVGMRECCNTCGVSFVGHCCSNPTYLENRKVFIVPRKRD